MKTIIFLSSVLLFCLFYSCKKDKESTHSNTITPVSTLAQFVTKYKTQSQYFTVTVGQNSTITGAQGTIINITPSSFNGSVTGTVQLELKEYYNRKDIILGNLQTLSDNGLLATAGMIYIDVTQNGEPINNWRL